MNRLVHRLSKQIVQPAINDEEVIIELRPNTDNPTGEIITDFSTVDFAYPNATKINNYNTAGTISSVGINEGMLYSLSLADDDGELLILDGYLKLNSVGVKYSCDRVSNIPIELRGKNANISKRAKNIVFKTLLVQGKINPSTDYIQIPYVLNNIPDYQAAAIATITAFVVLDKVRTITKDLFNVLSALTSILGAVGAIIQLVIIISWIIIVLAELIVFTQDIFNHLIQPVKYHASMTWKKLLELACDELGVTLETTLFDDPFYRDTVRLPAKFKSFDDVKNEFSLGWTIPEETRATGYYAGSAYDLFLETKETFRARIVLTNDDKLVIEKITDPVTPPVYRLPDLVRDEWSTNQHEIISNYEVSFKEDLTDENTIDDYEGTITNAITSPKRYIDKKAIDLGDNGLFQLQLKYARASRKTELTKVEKRFAKLFNEQSVAINQILSVANTVLVIRNIIIKQVEKVLKKLKAVGIKIPFNPSPIPPLTTVKPGQIEQRIGMMLLGADFFKEPKVLSLDINSNPRNTKIKTDNSTRWHSKYIYQQFHVDQSFQITPSNPYGNQYRIYVNENFSLCKESAEEIISNKRIFTHDGQIAEVTSCKFRPKSLKVDSMTYKIKHVETTNLVTNLFTPDGL